MRLGNVCRPTFKGVNRCGKQAGCDVTGAKNPVCCFVTVYRVSTRCEGAVSSQTVGRSLEFLGLEWEDSMTDYNATALDRERIGTPSYHQVVQPIYSRADGRWRRYRSHLQPVLPVLLKWAAIHGYSGDP